MKTILITGATGYLGRRLTLNFGEQNYKVIALALNHSEKVIQHKNVEMEFLDGLSVKEIFDKNKIDIVVHTATVYGRQQEQNIDMIRANVEFPVSVLQEAISHKSELFINTDTILVKNINPYAMTKSNFADWLAMYAKQIKVADLKLDHFYGPHDNSIKFIAWIIGQLKNNVEKIDLTEGSQTRDFIYIDDVIRAFDCVLKNADKLSDKQMNIFEVGTNHKTSIKEMVITLKEMIGNTTTKLNFGAIPYRQNEVLEYEVNTTALRLLGWEPQITDIRIGLAKLLEKELER